MWGRSLCPPLRHPLALEGKGRSSTQPAFISSSPLSLPPPPLAPSPPPLSSGWGGCACGVCVCSPGAQFFKGFHGFRFRFKHLHLSSFLFLVACVQFFCGLFCLFVCLVWKGFLFCCFVRAWRILTTWLHFLSEFPLEVFIMQSMPFHRMCVLYSNNPCLVSFLSIEDCNDVFSLRPVLYAERRVSRVI